MYLLNEKMESILKNVYNKRKIFGLELMAAQYEYLLYQIYCKCSNSRSAKRSNQFRKNETNDCIKSHGQ